MKKASTLSEKPQTPLAVVGMACRLPGGSSEDEFWSMLIEGRHNYKELGEDRLKQQFYFNAQKGVVGKTYSKVGATYDFNAIEEELRAECESLISCDVGHWLAHHVAMDACRNAGYRTDAFPHKKAGVFMGFTRGSSLGCDSQFLKNLKPVLEYLKSTPTFSQFSGDLQQDILLTTLARIKSDYPEAEQIDPTRLSSKLAAWNIMKTLGLEGQAMIMDGACSSSLSALAVAGRSLVNGSIDTAIVGGASYFSYDSLVLFAKAQSIATEISCPFDDRASGLICGEAHIFLILKTLEKAVKDGDNIRAVIRGIGVSSDGKGKTLWAPRKEGQTEAVSRAYEGGADPKHLRFIEAHATSTPLGDPTEMAALGDALKRILPENQRVMVGSVKANVGHTLESAGVVGLAKAILVLRHKMVPPQIHIQQLNPDIDWKNSPLDVVLSPTPLTPTCENAPLQVAVNAFGIGGLNVHVVLEEFHESTHRALLPVSLENNEEDRSAKPVAVVGMGCVFPGANNLNDYWSVLAEGIDPKSELTSREWDKLFVPEEQRESPFLKGKKLIGGFITDWKYDWKKHKVPPLQIARANPLQFMILDAVDAALEDAGYTQKPFNRKKTSVVIGTVFGDDFANSLQMGIQFPEIDHALRQTLEGVGVNKATIDEVVKEYEKLFFERLPALHDETGSFTSSTLASRITKTYDLMGGAISIDAGSVASMAALETAVNMIRSGESQMVICTGAHRASGYSIFERLAQNNLLATENCDLLTENANGLFPGEGAGVLLLKSLDDAIADGDTIRAIIHGIGFSSSTQHGNSVKKSMDRALSDGKIDKCKINAWELSFAPEKNDAEQNVFSFENLAEALKPSKGEKNIGIGSVIGQFGHLGGASGIASLIKTILSMENLTIPGVFGLEKLNPTLASLQASMKISSKPTPMSWNPDGRMYTAVCSNDRAGDFETCYHVILERGERVPQNPAQEKPTQEILEAPIAISRKAEVGMKPGWAFMFPGQGSQYIGMLQHLAETSPNCTKILGSLDDTLRQFGHPTFSEMAWNNDGKLGKDVFWTQLSLLVADTVYATLLKHLGIEADLFLGHSYGEYPALVASGAWSFETAVEATWCRSQAIDAIQGPKTGMLSTNATRQQLQHLFQQVNSGKLYISNRNTPEQTVVSGEVSALKELEVLLKKGHLSTLILPVPAGFHSPLVEQVCAPLCHSLEKLPIRFPNRAFLSGVSGLFEAEPASIRNNLVEQMTRPVDFVAMIEKAYECGVRHFVEVGPRTVLSNMVKKILHDPEVRVHHCDQPKGDAEKILDDIAETFRSSQQTKYSVATVEKIQDECLPICGLLRENVKLPPDVACMELSGTPYQMGYACGVLAKEDIRKILRGYADIATQSQGPFANMSHDLKRVEKLFSVETFEEIRGMAEGAGVPMQSLLRHNLCAYPELSTSMPKGEVPSYAMGLACVYFAGRTTCGTFLHGGNVDVPIYRHLPGSGKKSLIQVRRPEGKIPHLLISGSGFVGGIFGINAKGVCISGAALSEFSGEGNTSEGELPIMILGKILANASSLDDAIEQIQNMRRCGAWSFCISEMQTERCVQVEYCGSKLIVHHVRGSAKASNHQQFLHKVLQEPFPNPPQHSTHRLTRLHQLLQCDEHGLGVSADRAFGILRDKLDLGQGGVPKHRTRNTIWRIDNMISLLVDFSRHRLLLASTDMARTDCEDSPLRYASLPLEDLLPELEKKGTQVSTSRELEISRDEYVRRNTSVNGKEPTSVEMQFNRYVLRTIRTVVSEDNMRSFTGAALIVGDDDNPVAQALAEQLSQKNIRFFALSSNLPIEEVNETLKRFSTEAPIHHIFLLGSHDPESETRLDSNYWSKRYEQGTLFPMVVLRDCLALTATDKTTQKTIDKPSVIAATSMGGNFGLSGKIFSVESGAASGLIKGIKLEFAVAKKAIDVKVVDHDVEEAPHRIAFNLITEMTHWDNESEIGYISNERYVLRSVIEPIQTQVSDKATPITQPVWIITGGARGITAAIACELGKQHHAKLHLIGSSPFPEVDPTWKNLSPDALKTLRQQVFKEAIAKKEIPAKAWERIEKAIEISNNFDRFQQEGVDVTYHSCDLTDSQGLQALLERITAVSPKITGIVHGAGFEAACRLEKKKIDNIRRTFDVKVKGAAMLLMALGKMNQSPEYFIGFSSVSGRFGGVGQTDYCAANEMLAKFLDWYAARDLQCRTTCFHWPAWDEIGMAVRPESKLALKVAGLDFMPPREGITHLLNEIASKNSPVEPEILITDWKYYKRFYPDHDSIPLTESSELKQEISLSASKGKQQTSHVLLVGDNADAKAVRCRLESVADNNPDSNPDNDEPVLILTTPRGPAGANVFGEKHWYTHLNGVVSESVNEVSKWIQLAEEHPEKKRRLIILTSLGFSQGEVPYIADGAVLLDCLEMWRSRMRNLGVVLVDLPAEMAPEEVADYTLRELTYSVEPETIKVALPEINQRYVVLMGKNEPCFEHIHPDKQLEPRNREKQSIDDFFRQNRTDAGENWVLVRKTEKIASTLMHIAALRRAKLHVIANDSPGSLAEKLANIRQNAGPITGLIYEMPGLKENQTNTKEMLEGLSELTDEIVQMNMLTRNDSLKFSLGVCPVNSLDSFLGKQTVQTLYRMFATRRKNCQMAIVSCHTEPVIQETSVKQTNSPLIDRVFELEAGTAVAQGMFDGVNDVFLREHRLNNRPILPVVVILETFAEAVRDALKQGLFPPNTQLAGFRNLDVKQGWIFRSEQPYRFQTSVVRDEKEPHRLSAAITGDYYNTAGTRITSNKCYTTTEIIINETDPNEILDFSAISDLWHETWYPDTGEIQLYHGKPFRCLGRMHYASLTQVIAEIKVPDPNELFANRTTQADKDDIILHAAVIDAALFGCGIHYWVMKKGICIPAGIGELRIGPGKLNPGETASACLEMIDQQIHDKRTSQWGTKAVYHFTIKNSQREVVYNVKDYAATVLKIPEQRNIGR